MAAVANRKEPDMNIRAVIAITAVVVIGAGPASAQTPAADFSKTANPELVGALAKELQATPDLASTGC